MPPPTGKLEPALSRGYGRAKPDQRIHIKRQPEQKEMSVADAAKNLFEAADFHLVDSPRNGGKVYYITPAEGISPKAWKNALKSLGAAGLPATESYSKTDNKAVWIVPFSKEAQQLNGAINRLKQASANPVGAARVRQAAAAARG